MQISEILSPDRVRCDIDNQSKKAALETLSSLIADADSGISQGEVFDSLIARERLGSTGLGEGIALPHGRLKNADHALGAFIRLRSAIDYDAVDQKPVDLLFALLVPEESTEEHLQILSKLAELFSKPEMLGKLRSEGDTAGIFSLLTE
ncbi:MAG: PTS IIA-like nitrogen regulatory protein PtsN [Gammaproteobacteria bacterium]